MPSICTVSVKCPNPSPLIIFHRIFHSLLLMLYIRVLFSFCLQLLHCLQITSIEFSSSFCRATLIFFISIQMKRHLLPHWSIDIKHLFNIFFYIFLFIERRSVKIICEDLGLMKNDLAILIADAETFSN